MKLKLSMAINNGDLNAIKNFIKHGENINDVSGEMVSKASLLGHLKIVKYLDSLGLNSQDKEKALLLASSNGHIDIIKYLVEKNTNIYTKDKGQNDALFYASINGHVDIVRYLVVEHNFNPENAFLVAKRHNVQTVINWCENYIFLKEKELSSYSLEERRAHIKNNKL